MSEIDVYYFKITKFELQEHRFEGTNIKCTHKHVFAIYHYCISSDAYIGFGLQVECKLSNCIIVSQHYWIVQNRCRESKN